MASARPIYFEGIDPNSEAGKYYAANRDKISDSIISFLKERAENEMKELAKYRKTIPSEFAKIFYDIMALYQDRTYTAANIIVEAMSYMNFVAKFLKDFNEFPDWSATKREEYITLSHRVHQTTCTNLQMLMWFEDSWKSLPAASSNSIKKEFDNVKAKVSNIKSELIKLANSLPQHLVGNRFLRDLAERFLGVEKTIRNGENIIIANKVDDQDYKALDALVERSIKISKTAAEKYNNGYVELVPVHDILRKREARQQIAAQATSVTTSIGTNSAAFYTQRSASPVMPIPVVAPPRVILSSSGISPVKG
jgi:hypothetical protein